MNGDGDLFAILVGIGIVLATIAFVVGAVDKCHARACPSGMTPTFTREGCFCMTVPR